ncbi:MAG: hypothetical protein GEV05_14515 [Betaproteobacteria bacterium]|nr:hypothetical protein [Betaproteobacteria bacterium]
MSIPSVTHVRAEHRAILTEAPDDLDELNRFFDERGWTDGFPIVPPTPERVTNMLRAIRRAPDELIATISPGFGAATVEHIAVNAVMAGCRPEYMPVLIAAVQAVSASEFNLQGIQATTNPAAVWLVVNGPIACKLGVACGTNCLGQGVWANATLGRGMRLILQNIGGARPAEMDRATQGQPGKYSFCCAENEDASPWDPLHVERGFAREESTVTVIGPAGTTNMNTHAKDAEDVIRVIAETMAFPPSNDYWIGGEPWLVIAPEHAEIIRKEGYSKADLKRALWERSKMRAGRMAAKDFERTCYSRRSELGEINANTMLPIASKPEEIGIIVAGGPGTHSVYVPSFGDTRAVTRRIE